MSQPRAAGFLAGLLLALPGTLPAAGKSPPLAPPPAATVPWLLTLGPGRVAPTTLTVRNRCLAPHRFEAAKEDGMAWFGWPAATTATVDPVAAATLPAEVDTRELSPGLYEGRVTVRCLDCDHDVACAQDRQGFLVTLRVPWDEATLSRLRPEELVPGELLAVLDLPAERRTARAAMERIAAATGLTQRREVTLAGAGYRLSVFALSRGAALGAALLALQGAPEVRWAQPNFVYHTAGAAAPGANPNANPGADPLAELQYGPRLLHAAELQAATSGTGVKVVIVDSGVEAAHPDLVGALLRQVSFVPGRPVTPQAHGTAMVGILAARVRNGIGIAGLAPQAEVLLAQACAADDPQSPAAACTTESVSAGLDLALRERARVVALSLGGPRDPLVARLCAELARRDALLVAAAGNGGPQGEPSFPAALPEVLAVAAIDARAALYPASTRGDYVDLAAPGVEVLSTAPGGRYLPATGTSVAAAHVVALAVVVLQLHPGLHARELAALLASTARDLGAPGKDPEFGAGLPDAAALLARLRAPAPR